jgi:hypothetical protein
VEFPTLRICDKDSDFFFDLQVEEQDEEMVIGVNVEVGNSGLVGREFITRGHI